MKEEKVLIPATALPEHKEEQEVKVIHNYKDSLFVDLFGRCKDAKENFISLYNAITDKNLDYKTAEVKPMMLEQTIYTGRYNDVSMIVDNKLIVLVEHQSTVNENMPFRFLEYITKIYEKLIPPRSRYTKEQVKLPTPEFYVIYNGEEDYPAEKTQKLSDAFLLKNASSKKNDTEKDNTEKNTLELLVKVFNINKEQDTSKLMKCIPLAGYTKLINTVHTLMSQDVPCAEAVDSAVKQCISQGILKDYLLYNSTALS